MAHRLLRILVFSSSLLLEGAAAGCATSHGAPEPDGSSPDASRPDAPRLVPDAPLARDVGRPDTGLPDAPLDTGTDAPPDAPEPVDAPDAAILEGDAGLIFCEMGWPTTKAQTCSVDTDGVTRCCRPAFFEDAGPSCCIARPEDHF